MTVFSCKKRTNLVPHKTWGHRRQERLSHTWSESSAMVGVGPKVTCNLALVKFEILDKLNLVVEEGCMSPFPEVSMDVYTW